jgi:hypothetical protein
MCVFACVCVCMCMHLCVCITSQQKSEKSDERRVVPLLERSRVLTNGIHDADRHISRSPAKIMYVLIFPLSFSFSPSPESTHDWTYVHINNDVYVYRCMVSQKACVHLCSMSPCVVRNIGVRRLRQGIQDAR